MIPPATVTPPSPPTCAYAQQCRAAFHAEWAAHPELVAMMPAYCALLHKRDVREWQIRDCQKAMGFVPEKGAR